MKRINRVMILVSILTMCSGCSINYNIDITADTIKENIEITDLASPERTKQDIYNEYDLWYPTYINAFGDQLLEYDNTNKIDGVEYHNKTIKEINNGYYYTYKYNYPIEKYGNASTIREVYAKKQFYIDNSSITINTDSINLLCNYSYFDELNVNITIDSEIYKVNYSNADSINNNKYSWKLNRTNCEDSKIILTLDKIIDKSTTKSVDEPDYIVYILYGILILIILIVYFIFKKLKEKNEKMDLDD